MAQRPLKKKRRQSHDNMAYAAAYYRDWREKNRAHLTAYAKQHRAKNKVRYQEIARDYRKRNREKINARRSQTRLIGGLITPAQYDELLAAQHGACAICKESVGINPSPGHKRRRVLCVDHDHKSNRVRGLLCARCNFGLGYFRDSADLLKSALIYLTHHKT